MELCCLMAQDSTQMRVVGIESIDARPAETSSQRQVGHVVFVCHSVKYLRLVRTREIRAVRIEQPEQSHGRALYCRGASD